MDRLRLVQFAVDSGGAKVIQPDRPVVIVRPIRLLVATKAGRFVLFELVLGDGLQLVAGKLGVIIEAVPRQREIVLAHAKQAAESHDDITDLSVILADHDLAHGAKLFALGVEHGGTFDLVRSNHRERLVLVQNVSIRVARMSGCGHREDASLIG